MGNRLQDAVRTRNGDRAAPSIALPSATPIAYREPDHADLPHVVKFSGGRSSAALAFMLAERGSCGPNAAM